jgi:hypothetical protein
VDAARQSPKTDKGWQAYLSNVRAPAKRVQKPLGAGLAVLPELSGIMTFLARLRRRGETNPRTIRIGAFPAVSVTDARRKLAEMKSVIREGRDRALEQRRVHAGVSKLRTLNDLVAEYLTRREDLIAPGRSRSRATCSMASSPRRWAIGCSPISNPSILGRPSRTMLSD